MNKYKDYWDKVHSTTTIPKDTSYCDWLKPYDGIIERSDDYIIDLGCGTENKIKYLLEKGKKVLASDYSETALKIAEDQFKENITKGDLLLSQFDMTGKFPIETDFTNLIIADLSLHYFNESTTIDILKEVRRVLKKDGNLLFRVNSIKELNYNPNTDKELEKNFYYSQGYEKRFFDLDDINYFFKDFKIEDLKEESLERYGRTKVLFKGNVKNK